MTSLYFHVDNIIQLFYSIRIINYDNTDNVDGVMLSNFKCCLKYIHMVEILLERATPLVIKWTFFVLLGYDLGTNKIVIPCLIGVDWFETFIMGRLALCLEKFMNCSWIGQFYVQEPFMNCSWTMCIEMFLNPVPWNVHELFTNRTISCSRTIHVLFMNSVHELFMQILE